MTATTARWTPASPVSDIYNGDGTCSHPINAGSCLVGGTWYSAGQPCAGGGPCQPGVSQTSCG